ncbi:ubiquinone biosynthesis monooxygenase COQ6, mitochondrial [Ananas comosus]|uniref:Ubiquinone biosynthesis monooxygenase COQ6, mitochondrial n=1 Tax=Ananas comosus TaxID=4615 RepID=A0A6P5FPA3_ANACO|nr:ubiquinone biosynthesis monooxygenase COQ6, mitochondrial [Ananas comosus]
MRASLSTILIKRGVARRSATTILAQNVVRGRGFCNDSAGSGASSPHNVEKTLDCEESDRMKGRPAQCDIAIVGGGMVGLALACALSSKQLTKQLSVAIIDNNPALRSRNYLKKDNIPDSRVSTVTPGTISFFKEIGAWEHVQQQRHAFFDKMQVWDYTGLGYTRYNARDVGKDYLGCVVENKVLCNSLLLSLLKEDYQPIIYPARLHSMTFQRKSSPDGISIDQEDTIKQNLSGKASSGNNTMQQTQPSNSVKLDLSDGQGLYAKLVVGADGGKSRVRELSGIKTTGWNYSQSAVICTVEHTAENHCAWQRFLPSGPIALLPIGDNYSNIVWTMTPEGASHHKSMSEEDFVKSVNHALDYGYGPHPQSGSLDHYVENLFSGSRFGAQSTKEGFEVPPKVINVVSERMAFPLSLMHAYDYASKRVALIGDAAHTVHPLAGQGVNLGFGDASDLAKIVAEGVLLGADIGELSLLKKYEKERKAANIAMMAILDGFQKAYSVDIGPVNLLRAAAFHGAQYIAPLKRNIISYAMGEQKWPLAL